MAAAGNVEFALLPPQRRAVILSQARRQSGLDVVEVAQRSAGKFSPKFLDEVERGQTNPDLASLRALQELYGVGTNAAPQRNELVLDLNSNQLRVGEESVAFESATADNILGRYVSMLYVLRNAKPGSPLPLRDADIVTLTDAFHIDPNELQRQVDLAIAEQFGIGTKGGGLSKKMMALIAAALTSVGVAGFVLLDSPASPQAVGSVDRLEQTNRTSTGLIIPSNVNLTSAQNTQAAELAESVTVTRQNLAVETATTGQLSTTTTSVNSELASATETQDQVLGTAIVDLDQIGSQIEARVPFDIAAHFPGWTINYEAESVRYSGLTNSRTKTITMFVGADTDLDFAADVLVHELGHAIDLEKLDNDTRHQWLEMRGIEPVWWTESGRADFEVGSGDFAEAVAALVMGSPSNSVYGEFTPEQLAFVAELTGLTATR